MALAIDPVVPAALYAGTASGVFASADGAKSWTAANDGLPIEANGHVGPLSALVVDPAGTVYAGQQPQNSNNPHSVSQYDVACFQVSQH